jgi:hypothetical protein
MYFWEIFILLYLAFLKYSMGNLNYFMSDNTIASSLFFVHLPVVQNSKQYYHFALVLFLFTMENQQNNGN